jgi:hypothetical protein
VRAILLAVATGALLVIALPLVAASGTSSSDPDSPAPRTIPTDLVPVYHAAADAYNVPWLLLASIHQRETGFSTLDAPGVRSGANGCGAAGPMQFGIVDVAPYQATAPDCGALTGTGAGGVWATYRDARDRLPADLRTTVDRPPACRAVPATTGCVYADTDAVAAAASYLHDLGAGPELDDAAWQAARRYNGAPAYADAVMARACAWETRPTTIPTDAPTAVRAFDVAWGARTRTRSR